MNDERIWSFEESLWIGDADNYRAKIDEKCVMALPAEPHVFDAEAAIEAVIDTPRWNEVSFSRQRVERPEEGLIVIAYHARASRPRARASDETESYEAFCTTTMRRLSHEEWRVVQHSQTVPLAAEAAPG